MVLANPVSPPTGGMGDRVEHRHVAGWVVEGHVGVPASATEQAGVLWLLAHFQNFRNPAGGNHADIVVVHE